MSLRRPWRRITSRLAFDGLDTVASVFVNGQLVGEAANMHCRHRFDVKAALRARENELEVRFASPTRYALAMEERLGSILYQGPAANPPLPHNMIRKMSCNFGWDWGPQLITSGIWRPARLEAWSTARITEVRPLVTRADAARAVVDLRVDVAGGAAETRARLFDPSGELVAEGPAGELVVDDPELWWPTGYGPQPLYRLEVELLDSGGGTLDHREHRIGLRTTALITAPDESETPGLGRGETFHLEINGVRVFCKGANWIPDDCFPHRVTPDRYRARIEQALAAEMNMLRVWGGGLYEDDAFYEICAERGMLVWQDFCMACACYSEEEPLRSLVAAEARDNVARLARHPALVLWNGCNENIWAVFDWGDHWVKVRTDGERTWGLGYYLDVFPSAVAEIDPSRPFWPGSPYSGSMDRHPNLNEYGNRHIWDVWNGTGDARNYLGHFPRFASEFGYQGPPTWPTIERSMVDPDRDWLSEISLHHNKQVGGQEKALERIQDSFELPEAYEDIWFLASINQCRALTLGCEWFRALSPWCSGALYWQLNDCWPVTSWAALDGDGRPKLLWHATRRFFRPRLATLMPAELTPSGEPVGAMALSFHNDDAFEWGGSATIRRFTVAGELLDEMTDSFAMETRGSAKIPLPATWTGKAGEFLVADVDGGERAWWFFGDDRDINYPTMDFDAELTQHGDVQRLIITSHVVLRELCLLADKLDAGASVDGQLVNLLPGESTTLEIRGGREFSVAELTAPAILRSVNCQRAST